MPLAAARISDGINSTATINQVTTNLISIYAGLTDIPIKDIEVKYEGEGYGKFKGDLAEIVKTFLVEFQRKIRKFL